MRIGYLIIIFSGAFLLQNGNSNLLQAETEPQENDIRVRIQERDAEPTESVSGLFSLKPFMKVLNIKELLQKKATNFGQCMSCRFAVAFLKYYVNNGATADEIGVLAYRVCTTLNIETPRVCEGVAKQFKGMLTEVILKVVLNADEICGFVFLGCGEFVNPLHNWTVPMTPFPKPPVKPPVSPKPGSPTLRVLHVSDIHIDPYYAEGSNANCGEPLCCRAASGTPETPADAAGYWGDYRNCDVPLRVVENMLDHINKTQKIDYVIWTGDIPPHDIWNNSRAEALYLLHQGCKLIHKYLGSVPIYPALGNHESSPVNSFPIPEIKGNNSINWLYSELASAWSQWIPDSYDSVKTGAYYTALVQPGLRIISLNMNYCNNLNWWLLMNSTDPTSQLAWLVVQLQMSESAGEKVHIIGHIPPGEPDCLAVWSTNYYNIINRYENTVVAQFFGHTHFDEFEVFYDKSGPKPRPSNIAYVGPSVTTYEGVNPGYRVYLIDGNYSESSRVVLDHETYIMNLTEANLYKIPKWKLEYSMKDAFNMSSLLPQEWDILVDRLQEDDDLFQLFYKYYRKQSDQPIPECDKICKNVMLCRLRRGQSNAPLVC